jgi:hypothetical protein
MRNFESRDFRNGHGLAGSIASMDGNNIVIKDRDGKENTVVINDKTVIKSGISDLKISDLKNNDNIVVIGKPADNGVVSADFVRVFGEGAFQGPPIPDFVQ